MGKQKKLYRLTKSKQPTFKYLLLSTFKVANENFVIFMKYKKDKIISQQLYADLSSYIINMKRFPCGNNYLLAHFNVETNELTYDNKAKDKLDAAIFLATLLDERSACAKKLYRNNYKFFIDDDLISKIEHSLKEDYK